MKKTFYSYIIVWFAVLGLFNLITFISPSHIDGKSKYDLLFWIAYSLITLCFIAHLVCTLKILNSKKVVTTRKIYATI